MTAKLSNAELQDEYFMMRVRFDGGRADPDQDQRHHADRDGIQDDLAPGGWQIKIIRLPCRVQGGAGFFYVPKLLSNELVGDRLGDVQGAVLDVVHTEEHGCQHHYG